MRTNTAIKNLSFSLFFTIPVMLIKFVTRYVFVRCLSFEYLGASGLFTNILTVLSFAELGIGNAIVFSLYKPLAENDHEKIKSLIHLYKTSYLVIAIIVAIGGLCAIPFLPILTNNAELDNLVLIYILYLADTVITYLTADKQSLLLADQKRYIVVFFQSFITVVQNVLQIIALIVFKNFLVYLFIQILCKVAQNGCLKYYVLQNYKYLNEKNIIKLQGKEKKDIVKNIKAMFFHQTGNILVDNTDNIIMSSFVGLASVGIYSNYMTFINAAVLTCAQISYATQASVGNLNAEVSDIEYKYKIFKHLDFMNMIIYGAISLGFFALFTPLMYFYNNGLIFDYAIISVIIINFFINGLRINVNQFKNANGLFYRDRYKPIAESIANLVLSLILVQKFGIFGVLFATTLVRLFITCPIEQYVVLKYLFNKSFFRYYLLFIVKLLSVLLFGSILHYLEKYMFSQFELLLEMIIICVFLGALMLGCVYIFRQNEHVKYFVDLVMKQMKKIMQIVKRKLTI